ncbi:MAG: signal peptidase II [Lachnospiraceae bacterium]|jgi:signal peptidase II|nr:signal peptidase II [Lachnospiraceae bacterium]
MSGRPGNADRIVFPALAAGVFTVDRLAKRRAKQLAPGEEHRAAGGHILLRNVQNSGAMLNAGEKDPETVRKLSLGLTAVMTVVFAASLGHSGKKMLKAGLALLLGGSFSNLYDRYRDGAVTDYISFDVGIPELRNVVFNIADFAIITGAGLTAVRQ